LILVRSRKKSPATRLTDHIIRDKLATRKVEKLAVAANFRRLIFPLVNPVGGTHADG
jgi:hypothetical protein